MGLVDKLRVAQRDMEGRGLEYLCVMNDHGRNKDVCQRNRVTDIGPLGELTAAGAGKFSNVHHRAPLTQLFTNRFFIC